MRLLRKLRRNWRSCVIASVLWACRVSNAFKEQWSEATFHSNGLCMWRTCRRRYDSIQYVIHSIYSLCGVSSNSIGLACFFSILGAGLIQLLVGSISLQSGGMPYPTVGASGGTYGILLAFGMLFPYRRILLLFPPIPMQARYFVILFGGIELVAGVTGLNTGIAHFAHLGGMLFGFLLILYWRGKLPVKPKYRMNW